MEQETLGVSQAFLLLEEGRLLQTFSGGGNEVGFMAQSGFTVRMVVHLVIILSFLLHPTKA